MRLIPIVLLATAAAFAQAPQVPHKDAVTFIKGLTTITPPGPTALETTASLNDVATLSKGQAAELIPVLFAALKSSNEYATSLAGIGLYAMARRSDGSEIFRPHIQELVGLISVDNSKYWGASIRAINAMPPPWPPELHPAMLAYVKNGTGLPQPKSDMLALLLDQTPPEQRGTPELEAAALRLLDLPFPTQEAHRAAINAAARPGVSEKVEARVMKELDSPEELAQVAAIQATVFLRKVDKHRNELAKFANDPKHSAQTRRLAQDVLDGKSPDCTGALGGPPRACDK